MGKYTFRNRAEHLQRKPVQPFQRDVMIATELLRNVKVTAPCPARWEDMLGDEQCRFCAHCQKSVYNFSAMTAEEVVQLLQQREGKLCARYYQRPDGTVMTSDCGLGQARYLTLFQRAFLGAAAGLMAFVSAAFGDTGSKSKTPVDAPLSTARKLGEISFFPADKVTNGTNRMPVLLGKISC